MIVKSSLAKILVMAGQPCWTSDWRIHNQMNLKVYKNRLIRQEKAEELSFGLTSGGMVSNSDATFSVNKYYAKQ